MTNTAHRAERARTLAEIGPDELRSWLTRLASVGIAPEALVLAAEALDLPAQAAEALADDPDLGEWSAEDELESAFEAESSDTADMARDHWREVREAAELLGVF